MSEYTYEFKNRCNRLEKYEWDNVWWEQTDITSSHRVLYIGDSISCVTRRLATEVSGGELLFDGLGTSKAVDNPYFPDTVRLFTAQQPEHCAIVFNNGLHGWHLDDETEYASAYETLLKFMLEHFGDTPIFLALTTAVADPERNARVLARNRAVRGIAERYSLPVIDLYTITDTHRDLISADGVHLAREGYTLLAEEIVARIRSVLEKN